MNDAPEASNLERLKLALASACMGTWEWNPEAGSMMWDERMRSLFGIAEFSGRYDDFLQLVHPEDRSAIAGAFARTMAKGIDSEFRVLWPADGSEHVLRMRSNASCDEKTRRIIGIAWDITERRRTEMALKQERNLLATLMEHLPDHIYFKDLESRFVAVNMATARWMGKNSPSELIGKSDHDLFTAEHADKALADEREIIRSGVPVINREEKETWPDREDTWASTTKMPMRDADGRIIGTFGLSRDITPLKKLENSLAAERNLLRSVINNIPDPIFVKNARGKYILDNLAHRKKLGIHRENEVIGKDAFAFFSEATARNFHQIDSRILETGEPLLDYEEEAIGPDGNRRWLLTTKVPMHDATGDVLICINRDITEKKIAADRLAQLAAELRAKNEALQEDLEMARELQSALLPQRFPHFPHHATDENSSVHFYHFFRPSMVVSGDFFDVLDISDDKAGLFICDVMGHGVRAALVAATIRALVIELRPMWTDPGKFLTELNRALIEALKNSNITLFASAFYVMADLARGDLCFANAGHPAPIRVARSDTSTVTSSLNGGRSGPALGLIDSVTYTTQRSKLSPHDLLLVFTDGLFEVEGSEGKLYDYQELSKAVGRHTRLPATELCKSLIEEVQQFSVTREFNDDVCLVAMDIERLREH